MIDYEGIALNALANIEMAPDRRAREFNNLVTVMQAEIADLRQWGIPNEEIEERMRNWAEMSASIIRMSNPRT